jgi:hypothetical protein
MNDFPPRPTRLDEVFSFVEAFSSAIDDRDAIYVSSPLTTGQRAVDWIARNGPGIVGGVGDAKFRTEVYEPNRRSAREYVRTLRQRVKQVVIDPTAVADIPEWTQDDYRVAWGEVIARYCGKVIFLDDWQHSSGCAYEATVAFATHAEVLKADLSPLTLDAARALMQEAIVESEQRGANAAFLRGALAALDEASAAART